ncbi:hypothetical protein Tco_1337770 [Tanacetum coccineum]
MDRQSQPTKGLNPLLNKNKNSGFYSFNVLDNDDDDCFVNKESETFVNDSDSEEVDEDLIMDGYNSKPTDNAVEGASTPVPNVVSMGTRQSCFVFSLSSTITICIDVLCGEVLECVEEIYIMELQSSELKYTWNQKPKGVDGILKKIDRIMANLEFFDVFPGGHAIFQPYRISDHSPAVLLGFRLGWSRDVSGFSFVQDELDTVQRDLDRDPFNAVLREEEAVYVQAFNEAVLLEERFLRQKAKEPYDVIADSNGVIYENDQVPNVFVSHYEVFLGQAGEVIPVCSNDLFQTRLNQLDANDMIRDISDGEIKDALFSMDKIIANRIKESLKVLVNPNQSAFIPGRSIADNILLTQELMHNYHLDHGTPRCAFKVDIQKAYDTVDWMFHNDILGGFWLSSSIDWLDHGNVPQLLLSRLERGKAKVAWKCGLSPPKGWWPGMRVPHIRPGVRDKLEWVSLDGHVQPFSVQVVWQSIRPRSDNVGWFRCVWFPGCIPRHAFHMWLIMRRRLKTQDNLKRWDNVDARNVSCSLCELQPDSHEHIFFECTFSSQVWNKLRSLAGLTNANPSMDSIIQLILPFAGRKSSRSVISKLVLAAAAYFLWQERNNRLFRKEKRSIDQVVDCIINSVRLKLFLRP